MEPQNDANVIAEILAGDPDLYSVLVKRYQRQIYNLMLRMTSSTEDALDLSQETFIKAYSNLERFRPGGRFYPWLYTIGLNLARDFLRKKKGIRVSTEDVFEVETDLAVDPDQEKALIARADAAAAQKALMALPIKYREALILRYREDLPLQEVAQALEISVSAAKMRVHRGLDHMRSLLRKTTDEG